MNLFLPKVDGGLQPSFCLGMKSQAHAMWHANNKPFGLESVQLRLGGQVVRAGEAVMRLEAFVESGERRIPEFAELDRAGAAMDIGRGTWFLGIAKATCIF